jgi:hypothetical protein
MKNKKPFYKQKGYKRTKQKKKHKKNNYITIEIYQIGNSKIRKLKHRKVVEDFIGRYLNPEESIHHIDGNKKNNSIENLMLFKNKKEHDNFEKRIKLEGFTEEIKNIIKNRWK